MIVRFSAYSGQILREVEKRKGEEGRRADHLAEDDRLAALRRNQEGYNLFRSADPARRRRGTVTPARPTVSRGQTAPAAPMVLALRSAVVKNRSSSLSAATIQ
ncbi:unnamed protein product [Aureobasidium pullulans]|nr:unnamed protein product [Aureobasidium pullulans]